MSDSGSLAGVPCHVCGKVVTSCTIINGLNTCNWCLPTPKVSPGTIEYTEEKLQDRVTILEARVTAADVLISECVGLVRDTLKLVSDIEQEKKFNKFLP